ncbi:MAG: oxidoreductase [Proteobacteria bacterium]|nr:oxidoreductase [Pseudomonadota bacterium]
MNSKSQPAALVTGASSGMGKSIAKRLIADGYLVYVAARSIDKMTDLAQLGAVPLAMDISRDADIAAAVATITERSGGVDVLVNNAGYGLYGPVEEIALDEARYQFEVNVFGPARLTQLLLPAMRARGKGTIVNITSMGGKIYTVLGAWYHATKHALEGWSDSLRLEVEPFGIRVVVIEPGLIETGFGAAASHGLLERSVNGAYAKLSQSVAASMERSYGRGQGTDPKVIADVVGDAVKSARPKTRYAAGKYAKLMIWVRKWLGDRVFDRLIKSQM